jgi:hypothetical protein
VGESCLAVCGRVFDSTREVNQGEREEMKKIICAPLLALLVVCAPISTSMARASADRITRGEATAVLNAGPSGASAVLFRTDGHALGAPGNLDVAIRPYFDDGIHYCVLDWHVLAYIIYTPDASPQEASASFESLVMTFTLDGQVLTTKRTPVKRVADPSFLGADNAWFIQQGRLMSPSDLTRGSHTLAVTIFNPEIPSDNDQLETTFYVDPAGTGACL